MKFTYTICRDYRMYEDGINILATIDIYANSKEEADKKIEIMFPLLNKDFKESLIIVR